MTTTCFGDIRPVAVRYTDTDVLITLSDGRTIGTPLSWHPWLEAATDEQRVNFDLGLFAVDFPELDDGLDIEAILRGIIPRQL